MMKPESFVRIECEGCPAAFRAERTRSGRQARIKSIPDGWSQSGRSDKSAGRLAWWCPTCRAAGRDGLTPPPSDDALIEQLELMTEVARQALARADRAEARLARVESRNATNVSVETR